MENRVSRLGDRPQLESLSDLCFGEEPAYRQLLLDRRWRPEECMVAADSRGRPVAFVFALPFALARPGGDVPGAYVYSLGVHPDFRGQRIGVDLMAFVWDTVLARGAGLVALVPASASLFDYYRQLGYGPFGSLGLGEPRPPREGPPMTPRRCAPGEYLAARERLLADLPHGVWDEGALGYQQAFSALADGGLYLLDEGAGCAVAETYDGILHLKELLAPPGDLPGALAGMAGAFPGWRVEVRTRPDWAPQLGLSAEAFAVARWRDGVPPTQSAYFSLVLD